MNEDVYQLYVNKVLQRIEGKLLKSKCTNIGKILDISSDSAYNKIVGRSKFTFEETMILSSNLDISLDELFSSIKEKRSLIPFHSDGLMYNPREYSEYFENISRFFSKLNQLSNVKGHFLANEVPLFHLLEFNHLLYLKLYIWNKVNWNVENISKAYNPDIMNHHSIATQVKLLANYFNSFDSTEIWNPYMINTLISQFKYLVDAEIITEESYIKSFKFELNELVNRLEFITETGSKDMNLKGKKFDAEILFTQLHMGSELILVTGDEMSFVFHQLDIPNYIRSNDDRYIKKLLNYYNNIKKTANNITKAGESTKIKMFKNFRATIDQVL